MTIEVDEDLVQKAVNKAVEKEVKEYFRYHNIGDVIKSAISDEMRNMKYPPERIVELADKIQLDKVRNEIIDGVVNRAVYGLREALENNNDW